MKLQVARNGEVIGEWTVTELYPLLRSGDVFPSDFYWQPDMPEWKQLAELPCGKSVLATAAQKQMLRDHDIPFDDLITKNQVSDLMSSRLITEKQSAFMDMLGLSHNPAMSLQAASEDISAEINGETIDGPATPTQLGLLKNLNLKYDHGISRRGAADLLRFSHDAHFT